MGKKRTITYKPPGPVASAFHASNAFVRCIKGPVGSGKTSSCVMELFTRAQEQQPEGNVRRTRWAVIRNTYPQLQSTTIRTFLDWFPSDVFGMPTQTSPITHTIKTPLSDGTVLEAEFIFIALDGPDAEAKLKSLEVTGAFINEASEIKRAVFDLLTSRVGRFPARRLGGATWSGIIMDTNPPDTDHWIFQLFEEDRPKDFEIYHQPPGDSPEAENVDNLPANYYERLKAGKKDEWVKVFVRGEYGFSFDGKPIYPEYNDKVHCQPVKADPNVSLTIGIDFGLTPAAAICQEVNGQWRVLGELVAESMGALNFAKDLKRYLSEHFPNIPIGNVWGDPAGTARAQTDERTPFDMLSHEGIDASPAPTNDLMMRLETVSNLLRTLTMTGQPGLVVSPDARTIRKGFAGAYCFKRVQVANDERYKDSPDKNSFSHVADALQYALMGGGAGDLLQTKQKTQTIPFRVDSRWVV